MELINFPLKAFKAHPMDLKGFFQSIDEIGAKNLNKSS